MHSLVDYSSDSDSSDNDNQSTKLPLPECIKKIQTKNKEQIPTDNPENHSGRVRTFAHERGNWVTLVYISIEIEILGEIENYLKEIFRDLNLETIAKKHISLTKTLVLLHHQIEIFNKLLEKTVCQQKIFELILNNLSVFVNEEGSRTFIGLTIDNSAHHKMLFLLGSINDVVQQFNLETFYKRGARTLPLKASPTTVNLVPKLSIIEY
ncbi:USB1 family protein [Megaselia abdita]